jgi:hypothetical protein
LIHRQAYKPFGSLKIAISGNRLKLVQVWVNIGDVRLTRNARKGEGSLALAYQEHVRLAA